MKRSLSPLPDILTMIASSFAAFRRDPANRCARMRRFQGKDQALRAGEEAERIQGFLIARRGEVDPPLRPQMGELRPDPGVVEPRGDGVGGLHLPVVVQEEEGLVPVHDSLLAPAGHARSVISRRASSSARLHSDQPGVGSIQKGGEEADGVGASAYAGDEGFDIQTSSAEPVPDLPAHHRLELPRHVGVGGGPEGRADEVMGVSKLDAQSRSASLMASLRVCEPRHHRDHLGPETAPSRTRWAAGG